MALSVAKLKFRDQEEPGTPDRPMEDLLIPVKSVGLRKRENAAPAEGNCGRIKVVGCVQYNFTFTF